MKYLKRHMDFHIQYKSLSLYQYFLALIVLRTYKYTFERLFKSCSFKHTSFFTKKDVINMYGALRIAASNIVDVWHAAAQSVNFPCGLHTCSFFQGCVHKFER